MFKQKVAFKFTPKIQENKKSSKKNKVVNKPASFVKLPLLVSARSSKEILEKSKFFKDNKSSIKNTFKQSYI